MSTAASGTATTFRAALGAALGVLCAVPATRSALAGSPEMAAA